MRKWEKEMQIVSDASSISEYLEDPIFFVHKVPQVPQVSFHEVPHVIILFVPKFPQVPQ